MRMSIVSLTLDFGPELVQPHVEISGATALYPLLTSLHNHEIPHQSLESSQLIITYTEKIKFELAMEFKGDSVVEDSRHGYFMKQALLMV